MIKPIQNYLLYLLKYEFINTFVRFFKKKI